MINTPLFNHLSKITDPRQQGKVKHFLDSLLFLMASAVISGAESWEEVEDFGNDKLPWLRKYLPFEAGIATHDTIARVMGLLDPREFQKQFSNWMAECCELIHGDVIAIDGKSLRGSFVEITDKDGKTGMTHVVSAFSAKHSLSLGQVVTDKKSNEITAIPKLLDLIDIRGCMVTIDAMGCQTKIGKKIVNKGGDYLLAVKGNQPRLHKALKRVFDVKRFEENPTEVFSMHDEAHGRIEDRHALISLDTSEIDDLALEWPGIKSIGSTLSFRQVKGKKASVSCKYYISSSVLTSEQFANAARDHWSIENSLHWKLDVGMSEDQCRIRRENAVENFASVRHVAMNLLKKTIIFKAGVKRKMHKANRSDSYRESVLNALQKSS